MLPFGRKPHQNDAGTSPDDNESARNGRHMAPVPGTPATPDKTEVFESRIGVIGPAEADEDAEAREAYESLMRHRKVRRRKKRIKVGVILGVVAIIAVTIAQVIQGGAQSEGPAISTAFVTRGEFSDSVSASGSIKPVSSTVVTPEVDGIIQDVRVAEGSAVDRGDRLFSVKNDELDKAVRKAAQQVKTAKNEVGKAQAALETARRGAAAVTEGGQRGDASSVEMAKTDLESAKISLEEARSAYDDAVAQADKRTVTAPCDGTIIVMNAVNGASVGSPGGAGAGAGSSAGAGSAGALMTIADLSRMKVTVQINEVDVSRVAVGQRARVTFSALRQLVCEAQVTHVSTVSSSEAGGSGAGSGGPGAGSGGPGAGYDGGGRAIVTYAVELLIDSPDASIKPGMTANADIMIQQVGNALNVPLSALTEDGAQTYVSVVTARDESGDPQTSRVPVTVRARSSTTAAIEGDGIEEGTEVLLAGGTGGSGNGGGPGGPGGGPDGSGDGATAYGGGGA